MKANGHALLALALWAGSAVFGHAATITWTNTASGGWNTAANWNPNQVPGINDTVIITNSGVTVSLNGVTSVSGIVLGESFNCGTPTILSLAGQTLNLNGPLTVGSCGQFTVDGGALAGTANSSLSGQIGWSAGALNGILTVAVDGTLTITTGTAHTMENTTMTNNGTVIWVDGTIQGGSNPGTFIYNNGLWDAQSDQLLQDEFAGVGVVFNNSGTFRKSGGASEFASATTFGNGVAFNQLGGMIDVQNGTNGLQLSLQSGGTFSGGFITTNQFGLTVLGAGNFNLSGTVTGTNTWEDSGNLAGNNFINGALTWVSGNWNFATVTVTSDSTLIVAGTVNNVMENTTVTNNGTVTWISGTIQGGSNPGTFIYNHGLWDAQSDQLLQDEFAGVGVVFNNFSTFQKSGGTGNTTLGSGVLFNQTSGTLDALSGNILLQSGANLTGGTLASSPTSTNILGAGNFNIDGATLNGNVLEDSGNLTGNNVIAGALTWVAGNWSFATVTVATNSTVTVAGGSGANVMEDTIVTNNGTVAWASGTIQGGSNPGTFIYNNGLWDAQSDQLLQDEFAGVGVVFNNFGTFQKSGGTGDTTFGSGVAINQISGLVNAQTGDLLLQGGGTFTGGIADSSPGSAVVLSAGNFNINGTTMAASVVENAGNLVGTNVINGDMSWVAGNWNNAVVTITANATLTVDGGNGDNVMENTTVTNDGTVAWASGTIQGGSNPGTFIYNHGLWDAQSDQLLQDEFAGVGVVFDNFNTVQKSGGTGNTTFGSGVLFNQTGGTLDAETGNILLQGSANLTGGTFASSPTSTNFLSAGNFNIDGTTFNGNVVENSGSLTGNNVIKGALTWVAGNWSFATVTVATNSTVTVAGGAGDNVMEDTIVTNNGTVAWASGTIQGGSNPGTFIYNNGLWDAQSDQLLQDEFAGVGVVFDNFNTFQKSGGTGNTTFGNGVLFNQMSGLFNVKTNTVLLQGNGNFTGGTATTSPTATLSLNAGNFNVNGTTFTGNVVENVGNLVGNNVINGALTWVGGNWSFATVTIAPGSMVAIAGGAGDNVMENSIVTNNGTVDWVSGTIQGGSNPGTFIYNNGLWDAQSDQLLQDEFAGVGVVFNNNSGGTFNKSATSGTTTFGGGITFTNSGTLKAISGTMAFDGPYVQNHGTMLFGLASPATFGKVTVNSPLPLDGTLSSTLLGGFTPAVGDSFTTLTSTADSSKFDNLNLPVLPAGDAWQVTYNAASVNLQVVVLGPSSGQIAGSVKDAPTHGVPNVNVFAFTTNNPSIYLSTTTDGNGLYSLSVTNDMWTVGLSNLTANGYLQVPDQITTINSDHTSQEVDFLIQAIGATTPAATTTIASPLTSTTATLVGTVAPNGEAVTVFFEYGVGALDHFSPTNTITSNLNTIQLVNIPVTGLSPGMQYQFQLVAENSIGTGDGGIKTFTTPGIAPVVVTEPATDIGSTNATVNGSINPGGLDTTYYFEYGLDTNYGSFTVTNTLPAGNSTLAVTNEITNLQPATVYHYQLVAANVLGIVPGGDLTFTNLPAAPAVKTLPANPIGVNDATLNGSVNPNGLATTWYFEYGTDTNYGTFTPTNALAPTNIIEAVSSAISSLTAGMVYHFQLVAANSLGTNGGGDLSFTNTTASATINCPSDITTNSIVGQCDQSVAFAPTAGGNPTPTVVCTLNGTPITSPALFPVGTNTVTCTASNSAGSQSCSFNVIVNDSTPPIAGANSLGTVENQAASVDVAKVLLRDKSQSGHPLSIFNVAPTTPQNATVSLGAGKIIYNPAPGFIGRDTLTYGLTDGCGVVSGTIAVTVLSTNLPARNQISIFITPTSRTVVFAGVPGAIYIVQSAASPAGPWSDLSGPLTAAANGLIQFTDQTVPFPPTAFYRTRYVSGP